MISLKGAGVRLRPASPDDAEARFSLGTDADISRMFGVSQTDVKPITRDAAGLILVNSIMFVRDSDIFTGLYRCLTVCPPRHPSLEISPWPLQAGELSVRSVG